MDCLCWSYCLLVENFWLVFFLARWLCGAFSLASASGWYGLPERSLVIEAVRKAGGALPQADLREVDLGSRLKDEDEIWIPGEKIDINQASPFQISSLPGIGEILAQIIVEYRKKNGPFEDLSQLLRIPGIGKMKLEKIKEKINLGRGEPGG